MFVVIAGGGRTGGQLAALLVAQGHKVHLIEHRKDVLARIHHELATEIIYEGIATDPQILEQAGIREANVMAACTTSDADNLCLCYLARNLYKVNRTIARINNPRNAWLFAEPFCVDAALNQADVMATLIAEEMSLGDMMTLTKLRKGQYSVVEEKIPVGARAVGVAIKDLPLPDHCVIAGIIRGGEVVVPRGITTFEPGDEVLALTDPAGVEQLAALFARPAI
jgi:trk system potassium uptake protein